MDELWTHAYTMGCDCGTRSTFFAIDSTEHPEQLMFRLSSADLAWACMTCRKKGVMRYVRSWNHEPNDAEKAAAGLEDDPWEEE